MIKASNIYLSEKDFDGLCIKYNCTTTELINIALKNILINGVSSDIIELTKKDINQNKYNNYISGMSDKLDNINQNKELIIKYYIKEYNINPDSATQKTIDKFNINEKYLTDLKTKYRTKYNIPDLRFVSKPNTHKKFTVDKYKFIAERYEQLKAEYDKDIEIMPFINKEFKISMATFKRFKSWYIKNH